MSDTGEYINESAISNDPDDLPSNFPDLPGSFKGLYIRNLTSGTLSEQYPYSGKLHGSLVATSDWIAVQQTSGVDLIRRTSGETKHLTGHVLDVENLQLGALEQRMLLKSSISLS